MKLSSLFAPSAHQPLLPANKIDPEYFRPKQCPHFSFSRINPFRCYHDCHGNISFSHRFYCHYVFHSVHQRMVSGDGMASLRKGNPLDVVFVGASGVIFNAGPPAVGYRIGDTDYYDVRNPITLEDQPFYRSGSNTLSLVYGTNTAGYFNLLGGEYNPVLGKWVKARSQVIYPLVSGAVVAEIETEGATKLKE